MSKTDFRFSIGLPAHFFGARMMPGAFHQLTGLPAEAAMDTFLPLESVFTDFDKARFFSLTFDEAQVYFKDFFRKRIENGLRRICIRCCLMHFLSPFPGR